ncbi:hypothetical protein [Thalassotalea sp. G2M2-11]|uniref:hypothetical protein n=1 Tax=Thalassotalea sp. G2M2-11 TaxID=2787627 RepID=UPI0019D095B2|nr:hypothetical protein [Thalassotalea sp. G2M2-11]
MKDSTKRYLAALSALVLSGYFGFVAITELGKGNLGGFFFAIGMAATLIAIFKRPTDGKLYNTAVLFGGLPSLGFIGISIWFMFDGSFKPSHLFALIVGVVGLLTVSIVIAKDEEIEAPVEANE